MILAISSVVLCFRFISENDNYSGSTAMHKQSHYSYRFHHLSIPVVYVVIVTSHVTLCQLISSFPLDCQFDISPNMSFLAHAWELCQ